MKAYITTLWILIFAPSFLFAQSPYGLSPAVDIPILTGEGILLSIDIALNKKSTPITPLDTAKLSLLRIPSMDRQVVQNWSLSAKKSSDILLRSSPLVPIALPLLAGNTSRHKMGVSYLIVLEGMLATYTVTEITKLLVKRKRPYVYGRSNYQGNRFSKDAQKSFFSGHASFTAVNYFLGAKMFHDFYPDSDWRPVVWSTAAIIPAFTAWKRVKAGKHFVTDVLVGYAVGALFGVLIPELHRGL